MPCPARANLRCWQNFGSNLRPPRITHLLSLSAFILTHYVGATERSASAHALVERLLGELDRSGITWPAEEHKEGQEPKRDFNSLCLRLAQRLGDYAGERRIVILLDALNQLSDGHDLQWLPHRLGPGVRVIVSCVDELRSSRREEAPSEKAESGKQKAEIDQSLLTSAATAKENEQRVLSALASRPLAPLRVPLGPLTEGDVRTIVVAYLAEYCHELDREHLDTLCAITQARNPLYLLVMLNELRTLGGNDLNRIVPARIASMPQDHPDRVSLFRWVLQRLEVFNEHAPDAVRWWCLYLAHGRVGMASHELADLLVRILGADATATALRIERGLRRHLQRRGPQLDFFHGQLRQAVFEQYGPQADAVIVHSDIALYFRNLAVTKPLVLRSVNGSAVTVIEGGGIMRCVFLTNLAALVGFTLTNGSVEQHQFSNGGGVWCESPSAVMSDCVLTGSSVGADAYGGGAYRGTLNNCALTGNSVYNFGHGGGVAAFSTLNNCTLTGNSVGIDGSGGGGGGALNCTLNNCTLSGNWACDGVGAARSRLNNCVVYYNIARNGNNNYSDSFSSYSCTTPLPTSGKANLTNAPLFVNQAGGNLRLQSNSPCINAGSNASAPAGPDQDGNPRIAGGTVDIGTY